jgi:hypothetical protein
MPSRASNAASMVDSREARDIEVSLEVSLAISLERILLGRRGALSEFEEGESRLPDAPSH